jgi:hypothetical protein
MADTTKKLRDFRISIRLEIIGTSGSFEMDGVLTNISYSGALIEETSMQPEISTHCVLHVDLKPPDAFRVVGPFELAGHVVRHSPAGFAIEFTDRFDPDVRRMVDDAVEIVTTRC